MHTHVHKHNKAYVGDVRLIKIKPNASVFMVVCVCVYGRVCAIETERERERGSE